jgi:hypothetical protein
MRRDAGVDDSDGHAGASDARYRAEAEKQSTVSGANLIGRGRRRLYVHERPDGQVT